MKIMMVTSELVPFAKVGGLADAVTALSTALAKKGHDVRIVMPRYYKIDRKNLKQIPGAMAVHLGGYEHWVGVYESVLPSSKVKVYFIDHEQAFGRDGVYGAYFEPDFSDNPKRFSLLAHAAFQVCRKQAWIPDIVHAHDWATGLVPVLLRFTEKNTEFKNTASIFTIHNMGYQGVYSKETFPDTGLDWSDFYNTGFEDWDRINFLKAAIVSSDMLTTVSPTYAEEIKRPEFGFRMDGILRYREKDLTGILNGVDTSIWNPAKDEYIPYRYTSKNLEEKEKNKTVLQERMGLETDPSIPVFGMISRLVDQKGISELFGPMYGSAFKICSDIKLQMVVLGAGEAWCEKELHFLSQRLPNFRCYIGYDEELSHLIEAGSDFFLMPSRYEPCGLNQMYSLLYGTLPIVRKTGGLADTIENYNEETGDGTGFVLEYLSPQSIYDTVGWATYAWYNKKDHIKKMRTKAMGKKFGWTIAAEKYLKVYADAIEKKTSII
ncbi:MULTISPECIES: glycogen synthase GlgA [unclassified Treponema]|uniref:glycogen synthase GlgA n=1 Tax=unclassified Treponema TaxID=2638727 RepID=UPI0020A324B2|nr:MULTISPECIES: glycogen synthase GlgA [unclassified Treponema]UTC68068.1 glycogen synthase GlgA [Treponema sp. OMZ 789]UTC70790.1 glycogen synthase GlgA [Treponema sp. OMZ 790]UTC73530.1 glycogen synthase GlgA [Treponema sp. OMZ 791]